MLVNVYFYFIFSGRRVSPKVVYVCLLQEVGKSCLSRLLPRHAPSLTRGQQGRRVSDNGADHVWLRGGRGPRGVSFGGGGVEDGRGCGRR